MEAMTFMQLFREHLKALVSHVEEGPGLFYVHICSDQTVNGLQCLEKMTSRLNKVSNSSLTSYMQYNVHNIFIAV